ncbi:hypothetical protein CHS0354_001878 [Potamilus streckersoni]|uniref:Uncharacterized protein n=1 Tax=Potamilus streckersoni TaxID=2493646 RepID=A0AAE0TGK5_9BIVA|nr:hypothetical protein CHS0354_001878 [Potamilus streckersoni]
MSDPVAVAAAGYQMRHQLLKPEFHNTPERAWVVMVFLMSPGKQRARRRTTIT